MSDVSSPTVVEPLVVRPKEACQMLRCGHDFLWRLINSGELDSYADGGRRCITTESIFRYVASRLAADKAVARSNAASVAARKAARARAEA